MLIKLQYIISVVLILNCISCNPSPNKLKQKEAVEQLSSENWESREKGVFALSNIEVKDQKINKETQKKLVDVIEMEAQMYKDYEKKLRQGGKSAGEISDEMYKKYPPQTYGDYIKAVTLFSASKNIENSLPAIFKLIVDTDYNISPAILTLYGSKYLDFFIEKTTNGTDREREIAVCVLAIWISPSGESDELDIKSIPKLSEGDLKKAEGIFLKAINDRNYNVRYVVLSSLGNLINKPDVRKTVEEISKTDSEQFIRQKAMDLLKSMK